MKFKYKIESRKLRDNQGKPTEEQKDVFETFVCAMFAAKYPEGIKGSVSRKLEDIFRKIDASTDGTIDLSKEELEPLKVVFNSEEFNIHPLQTRFFHAVRENIDEALKKAAK